MSVSELAFAPAPWSRRRFLGSVSALSVAALAGCGLGDVDLSDQMGGGGGGTGLGGARGSSRPLGYTPTGALQLLATSELSEDYFTFTTHKIDPTKDTVIAYSRADGEVEAILLQDGSVKQIYRDLTQPGGWNFREVTGAEADVVDVVAGISNPVFQGKPIGAATLKVFYRKQNSAVLGVSVLSNGDQPSFSASTVPWTTAAERLQLTVNADSSLLVAAMQQSSTSGANKTPNPDARMYFYYDGDGGPNHGYATGFVYNVDPQLANILPKGVEVGWSAIIAQPNILGTAPGMLIYLPFASYFDPAYPSVRVWYAPIQANQGAVATVQAWPYAGNPKVDSLPGGSVAIAVEYVTVLGGQFEPTAVVRTLGGDGKSLGLAVLTRTDKANKWWWNQLQLPDSIATAPFSLSTALRPPPSSDAKPFGISSFVDLFLVANSTMSVIRQAPQGDNTLDATNPIYTPPIALQPGVAVMTSQAGQSTGNELIVVGTDGTLVALTKDPVTGHWSEAPIHLPDSELEQVSSYRVSVSLVDSWQNGVAGKPLTVTSSTPVTALVDGVAANLGVDPVTVVTDVQGQAVLALVADGLSAPTLTVTSADAGSVSISPSEAINTFMKGGTPLNNVPPLTADSLAKATATDGTLVAPVAKDDGAAAKDAVTNMGLAAQQASGSSLGAVRSATLRRRDGRLGAHPTKAELAGIRSDINSWTHDALHAIKKAAVKVSTVAYDEANKVWRLAADFVDWAENELQVVVHGIEDAAHVIHAFLTKLGGYIKDAVKWLEAAVLGTLTDSVAVARIYHGWIQNCGDFLARELRASQAPVLAWLTKEQANTKQAFISIAHRFAPGTTLTTMADNPPEGVRSSGRHSPAGKPGSGQLQAGDSGDQGSPHGNWFWQKVGHELRGGLKLPDLPNFEQNVEAFLTAAGPALADLEAAFKEFMGFLKTVVTSPQKVRTLGVQQLLLAVADMIDAIFEFAKAVVAAAFSLFADVAASIHDMLETPLSATPIVGKILGLVPGVGAIQVGTIVNLLFAFPTVVAYKIAHGVQSRPFANLSTKRRQRGELGDIASDLQFSAGATLFTWANFDTISAAFTAANQEPPMVFAAIDIAAPVVATVLTVPTVQDGQPYLAPPVSGKASDVLNFVSWILGAAPALTAGAGLLIDKYVVASTHSKAMKDLSVWWVCATAVLSTVTGMVGNGEDDNPSGADYAIALLNNMGTMAAPGLLDTVMEATEGVSVVVTMALTEVCGLIGAVLYGFDG